MSSPSESARSESVAGRPSTESEAVVRPRARSRRAWTSQFAAFVWRYLRTLGRDRTVLAWSLGFPTAFYLLTVAVFVDFSAIPESYHGAVRATTAISYGVFGAVIVALSAFGGALSADLHAGRYAAYRALPLWPTAELAGRFAAGLVAAFVALGAVLAVSVPTGATYEVVAGRLPTAALGVALCALLWMVVAFGVAVVARSSRQASLLSVSLALASYFGTGFNGTVVDSFGGPGWTLNVLPNTLATRLLVLSLVGVDDWEAAGAAPPPMPEGVEPVLLLAGYTVVLLVGATLLARRALYSGGERR